jgi:hypothetical protein
MSVFNVPKGPEDVELTMASVSKSLRQWETDEALPLEVAMLEDKSDRLVGRAENLMSECEIDTNAVMESDKTGVGPWLMRLQRLVRRLTWWFNVPFLHQIRRYQVSSASLLRDTIDQQMSMVKHIDHLMAEDLAGRIASLEARVASLEEQLSAEADTSSLERLSNG